MDEDDDDYVMPKKKRDDEEMDITPMIDITFLLLIFFVVCSKMDPTQMRDIPKADNGLLVSAKDSAVIFIEPNGPDKVKVMRADESEFSDDEGEQESEIVEYITSEIEKTVGRNKDHVMIMGEKDVKVMHVTRIQKMIGDNFEDLESTYIAVKEE